MEHPLLQQDHPSYFRLMMSSALADPTQNYFPTETKTNKKAAKADLKDPSFLHIEKQKAPQNLLKKLSV
ncbi:hypothetical protein HanXRQr2_Chr01g0005541 [Helianthus annuus]|uniref:Uncharacterized protein n=1 Tax=Helianthus annuus TaxID=4232 RepID=A0A9K3P395_HELAN|nr:hypothetical protein HanXRQr2_Chr01g0005541 [Helianthus annuus]KAJ0955651.1 hypothetical protein HanPSC8_Chr01g0005331 [Helianthus annuus]